MASLLLLSAEWKQGSVARPPVFSVQPHWSSGGCYYSSILMCVVLEGDLSLNSPIRLPTLFSISVNRWHKKTPMNRICLLSIFHVFSVTFPILHIHNFFFPTFFLLLTAHTEPPPSHCLFIQAFILSLCVCLPPLNSLFYLLAHLLCCSPFLSLHTSALSSSGVKSSWSWRREPSVLARVRTIIEKCLRHHS